LIQAKQKKLALPLVQILTQNSTNTEGAHRLKMQQPNAQKVCQRLLLTNTATFFQDAAEVGKYSVGFPPTLTLTSMQYAFSPDPYQQEDIK